VFPSDFPGRAILIYPCSKTTPFLFLLQFAAFFPLDLSVTNNVFAALAECGRLLESLMGRQPGALSRRGVRTKPFFCDSRPPAMKLLGAPPAQLFLVPWEGDSAFRVGDDEPFNRRQKPRPAKAPPSCPTTTITRSQQGRSSSPQRERPRKRRACLAADAQG